MRFPTNKNAVAQKHCTISAKKRWHSPPPGRVVLGIPSPSPRVCTDGRTLTSQPKFFGPIDYQISLAMELRWRVSPAGSAIIAKTSKS